VKKIGIIIFIFINSFASNFEQPDNSYSLADELEVDQKKRDKKIWKNMVQAYLGFRQMAKNSLSILERVTDWAWSTQKYMAAVENMSSTVKTVYKNIKELGNFKWYDFVGIIEYLEEDIFQYTDYMIYYGNADLNKSRERASEARRLLFRDPFKAKEMMHEEIKANKSYNLYYAEVLGCGMHQGIAEKNRYQSDVKRNLYITNTAAEAIAGAEVRNMNTGNKSVIVENVLQQNTREDGQISMVAQAEMSIVNNRNKLFHEVSQNEQINDGVKINSLMLIQKASHVDQMVIRKASALASTNRMVESMKRLSEEVK
jgi:hypothetical protein